MRRVLIHTVGAQEMLVPFPHSIISICIKLSDFQTTTLSSHYWREEECIPPLDLSPSHFVSRAAIHAQHTSILTPGCPRHLTRCHEYHFSPFTCKGSFWEVTSPKPGNSIFMHFS